MNGARPVRRLGDGALSAEVEHVGEAHGLATAVAGSTLPAGVEEVVPGFRSVTVVADPDVADLQALAALLAAARVAGAAPGRGRRVTIPVTFDGPDLEDVAELAGVPPDAVVDLLEHAALEVAFVGFAPGFPYLVGLPPPLADIPRRATPRAGVRAGSVALGGGFAGAYPSAMPGGWHLVGRTGTALFDPGAAPYSLLAPGDAVRFVRSDDEPSPPAPARAPLGAADAVDGADAGRGSPRRSVAVEEPGLMTLVEDLGRVGVAALGVPRAGAADADALELANRLVGNDPGAAALECTAHGPTLRFAAPAHVAVVGGADVHLDGRAIPTGVVLPVAAGQRLRVGPVGGDLRAYVGIDGGIDTPPLLGSRSSDTLCGLGPGRLVAGDEVPLGPPGRPHGRLHHGHRRAPGPRLLRILPGPDPLADDGLKLLTGSTWTVGAASDRVGVRLSGPRIRAGSSLVSSRGVVTGTVQLPPDGAPIVLSCDHATVGGYPAVAAVVRADLAELGRCRPGDEVRFEAVGLDEAASLRAERRRRLERQVVGWFPLRSD